MSKKKGFVKGKHEHVDWGHGVKEVRQVKGGPKPLELKVDPDDADGLYSNLVMVSHTESEFFLDFLLLPPGQPRAKAQARIISGIRHTKRFLGALGGAIQKYEARHGQIPSPGEPQSRPRSAPPGVPRI